MNVVVSVSANSLEWFSADGNTKVTWSHERGLHVLHSDGSETRMRVREEPLDVVVSNHGNWVALTVNLMRPRLQIHHIKKGAWEVWHDQSLPYADVFMKWEECKDPTYPPQFLNVNFKYYPRASFTLHPGQEGWSK